MRHHSVIAAFAAARMLLACGGTTDALDAGPDAPMPADAGFIDASGRACTCLALGANYGGSAATVSRLELPSLDVAQNIFPGTTFGDPVMRLIDDRFFVINRFGFDTIVVINARTIEVMDEFSTGIGSNPQDLAVYQDRAYVVALGRPEVLVYDLANTDAPLATIPLPTSSADLDGNPDAASIVIDGSRAYVALEHLQGATPAGAGQIAVIDLASETVEMTFDLPDENPAGFIRELGGGLLVSLVPDFTGTTGCVASVSFGETPQSDGCLRTHATMGGFVSAIAPTTFGVLYAVQSGAVGRIIRVNPDDSIDRLTSFDERVTDAAFCIAEHLLVVNDLNAGGLRVYWLDAAFELTGEALGIGLPPVYSNGISCYLR